MSEVTEPIGTDLIQEPTGTDLTNQGTDPVGEPKTVETPEDVEKSRAYHQTKAQDLANQNKALAEQLAQYEQEMAELMGTPPEISLPERPSFDDSPAEPQNPQAPSGDDEYEELTPSAVRKAIAEELAAFQNKMKSDRQAEKTQEYQKKIKSQYDNELAHCDGVLDKMQAKWKLPDEVMNDAIKRAVESTPMPKQLGLPTSRLNLVKHYLSSHIISMRSQSAQANQIAADQAKVDAANQLAQPVGGGTDTTRSVNDRMADEIVPDEQGFTVM